MRPGTEPGCRGLAGRRIVVLGCTGFLGRHLSAGLAACGAEVLPVSRSGAAGGVRLDLLVSPPRDLTRVLTAFGADVVVNAAGRVWAPGDAWARGGTNTELAARLVRALTAAPTPARLIHLGSIHEYGPGVPGTGIPENHRPTPVTPYGRDKLAATRTVLSACAGGEAGGGVRAVVLRLANVAGPQPPPGSIFGRVAAHLATAARTPGVPPPLRLPELGVYRDVVDVRDVLAAAYAAITAPPERIDGQVINIGSGRAVAMRDLVVRMIALSGLPVPLVESPVPAPPYPHVSWQRLDVTRARTLLSWYPRHPLDATLRTILR